jgi:hypothetical protein
VDIESGGLEVVDVNVGAPTVTQRLDVQGLPTLIGGYHGREPARRIGALPAGGWLEGVLPIAA